jgi:deoxyribose-phosphate aldolase
MAGAVPPGPVRVAGSGVTPVDIAALACIGCLDRSYRAGRKTMSVTSIAAPRWDGPLPTPEEVAKMIDHSLLRPELTPAEVAAGLETASKYRTASVCVRPADVTAAVAVLAGSGVAVGSVVGFPHGGATTAAKVSETAELVALGAQEIDMVIDIGRLRGGDVAYT